MIKTAKINENKQLTKANENMTKQLYHETHNYGELVFEPILVLEPSLVVAV
jgi:hypothetical protein